jgi:hypothetical protein
LLGGVALTVTGVALIVPAQERWERLLAHGTAVTGHVRQVDAPAQRGLPGSGGIEVAYQVGGRWYGVSLSLNDDSPRLGAGDTVTLAFDPQHPDQAVAREFDGEPAWRTNLMVWLLGGGLGMIVAGVIVLAWSTIANRYRRRYQSLEVT